MFLRKLMACPKAFVSGGRTAEKNRSFRPHSGQNREYFGRVGIG
jgi:hypothetical protein